MTDRPEVSPIRSFAHFVFSFSLLTLSVFLVLIAAEFGLRMKARSAKGPAVSAERAFRDPSADLLTHTLSEDGSCTWAESLYPDPNLGFVQHDLPGCGWPVNADGLYGAPIPTERDSDHFNILFLGGSVAQQLVSGNVGDSRNWVEEYLNANFRSPSGKPFRVINGALGSWKQPNQLVMLTRHGRFVEAFVSLEGFNEMSVISQGRKLEAPFDIFHTVVSLPDLDLRPWISTLRAVRKTVHRRATLRNSFLVGFLTARLENWTRARFQARMGETYHDRRWSYPSTLDFRQRFARSLSQYRHYLELMAKIGQAQGIQGMLFIQPIPQLYKTLTAEEKQLPLPATYGPLYHELADGLLARPALPTRSLLKIFENETDTIYADSIHPRRGPPGTSRGYALLGRAIAEELAKTWRWTRKP